MGVRSVLVRLAAGAPVRIFVVVGNGGRVRARLLDLDDRVEVVDTPRAATVLVVVGRVPPTLDGAVAQVHDQLAGPRATVLWGVDPLVSVPDAVLVAAADDPVPMIIGARRSDSYLLADDDPNPWRGVGPYGQGGKAMTGGTPYGRPMTGRAEDRDGLQLDQLPVTVGPFFPALPPGLVLHVKLQGDVVQEATVGDNPFEAGPNAVIAPVTGEPTVFERALVGPVPIAELELARARHHLWWLGDALRLQGLAAIGERSWRLAAALGVGDGPAAERLFTAVGRSQVLRWSVGGVGPVDASLVEAAGLGPVARAAGRREDARLVDPSYESLGFEPVRQRQGSDHIAARWRQRMAEVTQSLDLAGRAGDDALTTTAGVVESPRGPISAGSPAPSHALLGLVPALVRGLEWGDLAALLASLDIDMEEAARIIGHPVPA